MTQDEIIVWLRKHKFLTTGEELADALAHEQSKRVPLAVFLKDCKRCTYQRKKVGYPPECMHPDTTGSMSYEDGCALAWKMGGRVACPYYYPKSLPWWRRLLKGFGM